MEFSFGITRADARRSWQSPPRGHSRGFTLVEMMTVVAILGIFAAIALPGFGFMIHRMSVKSAADEFYSLMQYARAEAVTRGTTVNVSATVNTTNIVVALGAGGTGTQLRQVGGNGLQAGVAISAVINSVNFSPTGTASAGACFQFTYPTDSAITPQYVSLLTSGRVSAPSATKPSGC